MYEPNKYEFAFRMVNAFCEGALNGCDRVKETIGEDDYGRGMRDALEMLKVQIEYVMNLEGID